MSEWHERHGDQAGCPIDALTWIEVERRDGTRHRGCAGYFLWTWNDAVRKRDVMRYRRIEAA